LAEACRALATTHAKADRKFLERCVRRAEAAANLIEQTILRQAREQNEGDDMPRVPRKHLLGRVIFKEYKIYHEALPRVLGREDGNSLFFGGYQRKTRPPRIIILDLCESLEEACRTVADWIVADRASKGETLSEAIAHVETAASLIARGASTPKPIS
jgi:hypothetical protein